MKDHYFHKRGEYLTAHMLMDLLRGATMAEVFEFKDKDSPAYHQGRAVHKAVLEGMDAFNSSYSVGGPINPKTGKTFARTSKKFQTWAAKPHGYTNLPKKDYIRPEDHHQLLMMYGAVLNNKAATQLLKGGIPEVTVRRQYSGLPCQSRIDWLSDHPYLVDLKTCENVAAFQMDAMKYRYPNQMAFYREMISEYPGIPVYLIAVDKQENCQCEVIRLHERTLNEAQEENEIKMIEIKDEFLHYREELLTLTQEEKACPLA